MDETLLLTGTIAPKNVPFLKHNNIELRLRDYLTSMFQWIIESPFTKLVFCENSNYKYDFSFLIEFASLYSKQLEIIQYTSCNGAEKFGKGYGESKLISHAVESSELIRNSDCFYKITGRLFVENIKEITTRHKTDNNVFMRDKKSNTIDARFFKVSKNFYNDVLNDAFKNINDHNGKGFENIYFDLISKQPHKVTPLGKLPIYKGISGTLGEPYKNRGAFTKWREEQFIKMGKYDIPNNQ